MSDSDTRLEEWIEEFGEVTSYSYMIFSYFGLRDNSIVNQGLTLFLSSAGFKSARYMQIVEDVEEELAEAFGTKPGLNIQWIFPKNRTEAFDDVVINTINEGLEFLEIDYEFYGRFGNVD
tara:strand:- start:2522 stop:2881 length:360 start_codon:yes stop_codon:yes gene_type:complete